MSSDPRLDELARHILAGEAIDWDAAMRENPAVVAELRRLQMLVGAGGESTGAVAAAPPEPQPAPPPPPRKNREDRYIGDFRLVRTLGEGGMGIVYEAEQQHPRRPVALKVIRGGQHVGPDMLKLFQREAQTLARLRHPGIAALFETGVTDDGLHYFAMELVRGPTLSAWIRQRPAGPLTPEEVRLRLSVFKKTCDAVAYAHQRGVIHRDLKPGNVLIPKETAGASFQDPVPDVKVLDFGLARITDSDVQATTYLTEMGKVQGTLPYMSPEQVRGNRDEIDLRTDVYSLGVLLYEMVTGMLPLDVSKAQLPEAVRIICEEPPKSISASFTGTKQLHADVITIAGKCLEKEPSRRYQSAAALAEDVARYLSDQPILARPPSATYQARKLIARHKGPFAFAATVFVLVAVLAVTSTIQAVRIAKERDRANQEAETAKQVSAFLEGLFKVADPSEARGNTITAREILDQGAERIERELKDQPVAKARLLVVMAKTYQSLGFLESADALLTSGMEVYGRALGERSADYGLAMAELARIQSFRGEKDAVDTAASALSILKPVLPPGDPKLFEPTYILGAALMTSGSTGKAEKVYQELLSQLETSGHAHSALRIWCLNDLGACALSAKKYDEAVSYSERALAIREREFPPDHPERLQGLVHLGYCLVLGGDLPRARAMLQPLPPVFERVFGTSSTNTANLYDSVGELCRREQRLEEAQRYFEQASEIYARAGVDGTPNAIPPLLGLGRVQEARGLSAQAEASYRNVMAIISDAWGQETPALIEPSDDLARLLRAHGRTEEADSLERRVRELRARSDGYGSTGLGVTTPTNRLD